MADVVLIGIVVLAFFAVGFAGGGAGRRVEGGLMAYVVLIGIVVLAFFAVGFAVGVLIVGIIGRWRNGQQHQDADRS